MMQLKNDNLKKLCEEIKTSDEYQEFIRLKESVETSETDSFIIQKYHELQLKIQLNYSAENNSNEYETEFKKIMNMIQSNDSIMQYLIAEYRMNTYISNIFQEITKELDLPFLNYCTPLDMV